MSIKHKKYEHKERDLTCDAEIWDEKGFSKLVTRLAALNQSEIIVEDIPKDVQPDPRVLQKHLQLLEDRGFATLHKLAPLQCVRFRLNQSIIPLSERAKQIEM